MPSADPGVQDTIDAGDESDLLDDVAETLNASFLLAEVVQVQVSDFEKGPYYSPTDRTIVMPVGLLDYTVYLFTDYFDKPVAPPSTRSPGCCFTR
ncbi:MAG: hypothetical protein OXG37_00965 [Actinomycetia bacterium]|nr:hypothetical protein [Actinomycetes bacterium]